jgi:hypothetical protein
MGQWIRVEAEAVLSSDLNFALDRHNRELEPGEAIEVIPLPIVYPGEDLTFLILWGIPAPNSSPPPSASPLDSSKLQETQRRMAREFPEEMDRG